MKILNRFGLPEQYVRAAELNQRKRVPKRISVTELVGPPQIRYLEGLYDDEIEVDVNDMLAILRGQAWHGFLAGFTTAGQLAETTLRIEQDGYTITGTFDVLDMLELEDHTLTDHKTASIYSVQDGVKSDWESQVNLYRLLLHRHGVKVDRLKIVALLDGWMPSRAATDKHYPQSRAITLEVKVWPIEETERYMAERLRLHRAAEETGVVPQCTGEERWLRPPSWRVVKKGGKRATRVCSSEASARKELARLDPKLEGKYRVDFQWPETARCDKYCRVSKFCSQKAEWDKKSGKPPSSEVDE